MTSTSGTMPRTSATVLLPATATKQHRSDVAGLSFRKQIRKCSERIYVSNVSATSIFAPESPSLSPSLSSVTVMAGDEVAGVMVPVAAMSAVEVADVVSESEGDVTIVVRRKSARRRSVGVAAASKFSSPSSPLPMATRRRHGGGNGGGSSSSSSRLALLRRLPRGRLHRSRHHDDDCDDVISECGGDDENDDLDCIGGDANSATTMATETLSATAHKPYRSVRAGIGFRRCVRGCVPRILVANIELDSIFAPASDMDAAPDQSMIPSPSLYYNDNDNDVECNIQHQRQQLQLDDEVLLLVVSTEGRTSDEVADLIRMSEGDVTLLLRVPEYDRRAYDAMIAAAAAKENEEDDGEKAGADRDFWSGSFPHWNWMKRRIEEDEEDEEGDDYGLDFDGSEGAFFSAAAPASSSTSSSSSSSSSRGRAALSMLKAKAKAGGKGGGGAAVNRRVLGKALLLQRLGNTPTTTTTKHRVGSVNFTTGESAGTGLTEMTHALEEEEEEGMREIGY